VAAPLRRGANVALTREIPDLAGVVIAVRLRSAEPVLTENLVVATMLCDARSQVLSGEHFVFFNQLTSPDLSVSQLEQALGDDTEQIEVDLVDVPDDVSRIVVVAYLNEGMAQHRTLGQLREAVVRVLDLRDDTELVRSQNLAPELRDETGLTLAELYRLEGNWKFKVLGEGYANGVVGIAADHGVPL